MKKYIVITLVFCILGATAVFAAQASIDLVVDGKLVNIDVPPQLVDGRVLVPIRAVSEALGAEVNWDPVNHRVLVSSKKQPSENEALGQKEVISVSKYSVYGDLAVTVDSIEVYPLANITNIYVNMKNNSNFASVSFPRKTISFKQDSWFCQYTGNKAPVEIPHDESMNFILRFEGLNTTRNYGSLKFEVEDKQGIKTVDFDINW